MQAQSIAYSVTTIDQAFTQVYPQSYSGSTSSAQMLADAQTRWQNARAGYQDSMNVQAGVVQNLQNAHADQRTGILQPVGQRRAPGRAIRQPDHRPPDQQLADLTVSSPAMARAQSLDGARKAGERGAGPAADAEFPQLRRRLSARQRADVPLMRGRLLNRRRCSARAAGCVLVAAAIIAAAVQFHRHGAPSPLPRSRGHLRGRSAWRRADALPDARHGGGERCSLPGGLGRKPPPLLHDRRRRGATHASPPNSQVIAMGGTGVIDGFLGTFTHISIPASAWCRAMCAGSPAC